MSPFLLDRPFYNLLLHWVLVSMVLMLPFAWLSWQWAKTWIGWSPALRRRRLGVWAVTAGLTAVAVSNLLALHDLEPAWRMVIPMSIFAETVALPGALTNLSRDPHRWLASRGTRRTGPKAIALANSSLVTQWYVLTASVS